MEDVNDVSWSHCDITKGLFPRIEFEVFHAHFLKDGTRTEKQQTDFTDRPNKFVVVVVFVRKYQ